LLAHELTHVVQQTQPGSPGRAQRQVQRDPLIHGPAPLKYFDPNGLSKENLSFTSFNSANSFTNNGWDAPDDSYIYWWSEDGTRRVLACETGSCHQPNERANFATNRT